MADRPGVPCRGQGRESAETQDKCNAGCDVRSRCGWTTGWAESEAVAVTITEFVKKLNELKADHGDIPVVAGSIMGGYYEPDPEAETVELEYRNKRRFATVTTLCVVVQ